MTRIVRVGGGVCLFFLEGLGCGLMQRAGRELDESKRTIQIFSQGTHRWACFCNTKALLLVSPSPLTWSALHPNTPWAEAPARIWVWQYRVAEEAEGEEGDEADLRGSGEDGVNHFSLCEKATEHLSSSSTHAHRQSLCADIKKWGKELDQCWCLTHLLEKKNCHPHVWQFLFRSDSFRREKAGVIVHCAVRTPIITFASEGSVGSNTQKKHWEKIQVHNHWTPVEIVSLDLFLFSLRCVWKWLISVSACA